MHVIATESLYTGVYVNVDYSLIRDNSFTHRVCYVSSIGIFLLV